MILLAAVLAAVGCGKRPNDDPALAPDRSDLQPPASGKPGDDNLPGLGVEQEKEQFLGVGQWSTVGEDRIGVYAVSIGKPRVVGGSSNEESDWDDSLLQVRFNVENLSKTKKLDYYTPSDSRVKLIDEYGNDYRYRRFDYIYRLKDAARFTTLQPGAKAINDVMCFELPIDIAKVLFLTIDSPRERGKHRFRIPISAVKK